MTSIKTTPPSIVRGKGSLYRLLLFVLVMGYGLSGRAAAQYRFDSWTTADGVPHKTVRALCQTRDGYLWLATDDGLARFDGVRFTVFNTGTTSGIKSNRLSALAEDDAGNLWIATGNESGVIRYRDGAFTTLTMTDGLPSDQVLDVAADPAGGVLILTGKGVVKWRQGQFLSDPRQPLAIHETSRLYFDRGGALWINDEAGLHCFTAAGRRTLTEQDGLSSRFVLFIYQDRWGDYWISTREGRDKFSRQTGLNRLRDGKVTVYTQRDGLPEHSLWSISEDGRGNLLVGTGHNIVCFRENRFISGVAAGLPDYPTWAMAMIRDREGNVWVGTNERGLIRISEKVITNYSQQQGLLSNNVYPILANTAGNVWIGTWGGLNQYREGRLLTHHQRGTEQPRLITALHQDRTGQLWIGSYEGTFRFQAGRFMHWPENWKELPKNEVHAIHEDRTGALWLGAEGWLCRYRDGALTYFRRADGLPADDIKAILEVRDGTLWFGTNGGLAQWQNGAFKAWTERDGLAGNHIRCLYEDGEGTLWIGTGDAGLTRLKDGKFTAITVRDGLHDQGVFTILEDNRGNFWMSCNRGIYRVGKSELNEFAEGQRKRITSITFGQKDGMLDIECNGGSQPAGAKTPDGRLWFPTQKGVVVINPEALPHAAPPPVAIEECLLDRQAVACREGVRMTPDEERLEIRYTAPIFTKPEQVRFRYQLVGLDKDWVDARTERTVNYRHLPPGTYTFHVSAASLDGVWNPEGAALRIVIVPPFYRAGWFVALVALGGAALILFTVQRRINHLQRARGAQERFSRQLLDSQEQERKRIAAELHDSLNQTLVIIKNRALLGLKTPENPDRALGQLEEIAGAATQAIEEVKEIAYALRPYHLDRLGLTKAIADLLDRVADVQGLKITADLDDIDGVFAPESEINLYRIVQESLNNIIKHAQASTAQVTIRRAAEKMEITIQDDGRGFSIEDGGLQNADHKARKSPLQLTPRSAIRHPQSGGFGLIGLTERARMLGGQMTIQSTPGQGTTINLSITLKGTAL